jgi:ribosomal protein S18 acetylase RimI-like enzyme
MEIRTLDSERELERALRLTVDAWREAFAHVLSDDELDHVEHELLRDVSGTYAVLRDMSEGTVLVADDGEVVGWISVTWHPDRTREYTEDGEAEIRTLYVHPDRWHEGIGTGLLETVLGRLPASVERVVLETFRENDLGRSFYASCGFTLRGTTEYEVAETSYPSVVLVRER